MPPVRVFIVDDSAVGRAALRLALAGESSIEIVGEAANGEEALRALATITPDVVIMDVLMPGMNGLEATRRIMSTRACPILIMSELVGHRSELGFEALRAGALDIVRKPSAAELRTGEARRDLVHKLRLLAGVPVITRHAPRSSPPPHAPSVRPTERFAAQPRSGVSAGCFDPRLVCLGASTGGPPALAEILRAVAPSPPWPILVVQHMTPGFTAGMVTWLAESSGLRVRIAEPGDEPRPGVVYIAPDDLHLILSGDRLDLHAGPRVSGHRPSVDALFCSIADAGAAPATLAALLTGMGSDGAAGLARIRSAGGWTLAQDSASSVVHGMPKAAVALGGASEVLSLAAIAERLGALAKHRAAPL